MGRRRRTGAPGGPPRGNRGRSRSGPPGRARSRERSRGRGASCGRRRGRGLARPRAGRGPRAPRLQDQRLFAEDVQPALERQRGSTSACAAGGVQTSTKSSGSLESRAPPSRAEQPGRLAAASRDSGEDSAAPAIWTSGRPSHAGRCPLRATLPNPTMPPRSIASLRPAGLRRADTAEIASSSTSRPSSAVASSITSGGLMRMTCE